MVARSLSSEYRLIDEPFGVAADRDHEDIHRLTKGLMVQAVDLLRKVRLLRTLKEEREGGPLQSRRFALHDFLRANEFQLDCPTLLYLHAKNAAHMLVHRFERQSIEQGRILSVRFNTIAFSLTVALILTIPTAEAGRVVFVDNSRAEQGQGTLNRPFTTLAAAQAASSFGDVIFVAEGNEPYEGGIELKKGQTLVGSAYGLDALRVDRHIEPDAPPLPAVQGPGPLIRGTVSAAGDNFVAGCTILAERTPGFVASSPQGPLTVRDVWFRSSNDAFAIAIDDPNAPVRIRGGGLVASLRGGGISISRGSAVVTIDHFPISGDAGTAVSVSNRSRGAVKFGQGSSINLSDAVRDAIVISHVKGSVEFNDPIRIVTHGGRGLVVLSADRVIISGGRSRVSATNAAAVDLRDSNVDIVLESVSADASPPGRLIEGIAINKVRGRFSVSGDRSAGAASGGTIRNAGSYGVRVEQSAGVRIANVNVIDSGSSTAPCVETPTNLLCRAPLFLRHVRASSFENIVIEGGPPAGLNANNIEDVKFDGLEMRRSGVLVEEVRGTVAFNFCSLEEMVIEQRFNRGRVVFDRGSLAAPGRVTPGTSLLHTRTTGFSRLDLELRNVELREYPGAGVQVRSGDTSMLSITMSDARAQRLGGRLLDVLASQSSHAVVVVHDAYASATGTPDAMIGCSVADAAVVCVDLEGNHFAIEPSVTPIRLTVRSPKARLHLVGDASAIAATIDAPSGTITSVRACQ